MSMTLSTVSKLIRRLEDRLGLRLFDRSTRALVLTVDGQRYYEAATRLTSIWTRPRPRSAAMPGKPVARCG